MTSQRTRTAHSRRSGWLSAAMAAAANSTHDQALVSTQRLCGRAVRGHRRPFLDRVQGSH